MHFFNHNQITDFQRRVPKNDNKDMTQNCQYNCNIFLMLETNDISLVLSLINNQ